VSIFDAQSLRDASQRHPANSVAIPAGLAFEDSDRNAPRESKSGHESSKKIEATAAVRLFIRRDGGTK